MKTNKQKHNWLIDAALFISLLLSFWLELTGVALHQWLGVALGAGAIYHLLTHWTWVKSVTNRFFNGTSGQARLYYVIDVTVLIGLATITVTGLVISTWLNLTLTNFAAWKTLHVAASIGTLVAVVAKIGLHWRWIVSTAQRYIFAPGSPTRSSKPVSMAVSTSLGRREFLRLMGGVSTMAVIATIGAVDALKPTTTSAASGTTTQTSASATTSSTTVQTAGTSQSASSCTVRCNKGCSYPGHCRRYTDSNNNGKCDLGECA